jgi:putative oxidoreductase
MTMALGLLILRVVTGLLLAAHGSQKVFGWFKGPGFAGATSYFQSLGFRPAWFWTLLVCLAEFGGGLLLALGLLTPLASLAIIADMIMAILKVKIANGFWASNNGSEFELALLVISLALGLIGPGTYSLDAAIGFTLPVWGFLIGLGVVVLVDGGGLALSNQRTSQQHAL